MQRSPQHLTQSNKYDDSRAVFVVAPRHGFTLVEILIVIALMSVLLTLVAVASMAMIGNAKVGATKATIIKVQGLLQQRIDSVIRKEPPEKNVVDYYRGKGFGNVEQAKAMARKWVFRRAFPQSWAEIETYYPNLLTGFTVGVDYPAAGSRYPATESGEVLYFLLTKANVLGYPPEGQDVFLSSEVKDTDSTPNGVPEIVDAWQRPLRFYRWPTRLVRGGPYAVGTFVPSSTARMLMPALPTTALDLKHDSDDKFGMLKIGSGLSVVEATYFEQGGAPMANRFFNEGIFHTPETASLPLILSGGPDLATGLYEPSDTTNFGNLAQPDATAVGATFDDISNYNIRSGGQ